MTTNMDKYKNDIWDHINIHLFLKVHRFFGIFYIERQDFYERENFIATSPSGHFISLTLEKLPVFPEKLKW